MAGEWRDFALSELADLSGGFAFKSKDYSCSGRFVLRTLNIRDDGSISRDDAVFLPLSLCDQYARFELQPFDTLFVMVGATLGKVGFVRECDLPALLNQNMWLIRAKPGIADRRFVQYAFRHAVKKSLGWASGSARDFVRRDDYRNLKIRAPVDIHEQQAIACILGTLDDKIDLNRRMTRTLEATARAIFKSWFVDFDPVRTKAAGQQPPGLKPEIAAIFPDCFEDSELGEIPKGWTPAPLGDLVELVKGRSYRSEELSPSDTALVTLKSFARGGGYRVDGLKPFTGSYKPDQVVKSGEVVLSCTDVTQAAEVIGRTALVRASRVYSRLVASLDVLIIRPQRPLTRSFVYELGRSVAFVDHTYAHTTGTTVLHLSKDAVPKFRFPTPPAALIDSFDRVAAPIIQRIEAIEAESDLLSELRATLLPKLITGELAVAEAECIARRCG